MPRPESPQSQRLLAAAVDVALDRGLSGLSLSALARAIGSNNRMLLYYFGSKDELYTEVTLAAYDRFPELAGLIPSLQADAPLPALLAAGWRRLRAAENLPYLRLFFEVVADAVRDPAHNRAQLSVLASHWPEGVRAAFVAHGWPAASAGVATTQLLALWRGLQIDLLTGADVERLDAVHDAAIAALFSDR
ncbi:MAG: TetR/AcrR family transcriptional regulator [Microbacterium sp.]|uniref:TetR/AcrR family transcriptional regulator n=1 Tax=Microbacterium sp. TaxID=51671 RepID=UPI0039E318A2